MRFSSALAIWAFSTAVLLPVPARALTLAVSPFDNHTGDSNWQPLGKGLADMLTTDLAATEGLVVVERARLQAVVDELRLAQGKFIDPATAQKLGKGLGASHVLVGSFTLQGNKFRIDARAIEVASGVVQVTAEQTGSSDDVFAVEAGLAEKLRAGLALKPKGGGGAPPKLTTDELRTYGRGLDALDRGQMDEARRILATLALQRPDFAQVQRGLGQLSQRIQRLLGQSKLAPERVLALAAQVEAGQTDACAPLFQELMQLQSAPAKAAAQAAASSPNAARTEAARALARFYAVTLLLLDRPALSKPVCIGNQSAAGTALSLFLFTIWPSAKQVMDCHPVTLEQMADPQAQRELCEPGLRRVLDLRDAEDRLLVAASEYPALLVQLGQVLVERFAKEPYAAQLLPMIQSQVEFLQLSGLTGAARQQAIARAMVAKARQVVAQEAEAGMMLAMVQLPADAKLIERLRPATALLRFKPMREELAMGTARIELSTDAGASWGHTWPLATEPPGYPSAPDPKGAQPPTKQLVGDGGFQRGSGATQIDAMRRWYRDTAWLGPAWSEATFADLRLRLLALDNSELLRCTVRPDPVATRAARGDSTYGRVTCLAP